MTSDFPSPHRRYSFGPYTLDPVRRLLWRDGTLVPLTPKTVEVLSLLVERHGAIVEKDDLLRFAWPNAVVEENNLARHVSILRKALQQRRGHQDFISTIPGRGYMFVAEVREIEDTPISGSTGGQAELTNHSAPHTGTTTSSILICRRSLISGIARNTRSRSGTIFMSTSMVLSRQP